jgi:hypothetical protein
MKKAFKYIGILLLVVLVVIQFIRPAKNIAATPAEHHISKLYAVPADVEQTLIKACYDCHSNNTKYPWYSNVQPAAWWLNDHINDGKKHLNFDEFTTYRIARQYKKLEECIDETKDAEKLSFATWCETVRDSIKAKYPADSLVLPKRK